MKNPDSAEDKAKLLEGLNTLRSVASIRHLYIGTPASTDRPVIDRSYSFSLLQIFDDLAGHDAYQVDPVHKAFVENYASLWSKVQIYDAVEV